jgi:hypothetical protein
MFYKSIVRSTFVLRSFARTVHCEQSPHSWEAGWHMVEFTSVKAVPRLSSPRWCARGPKLIQR